MRPIESLTIGELRELVEPLSAMGRRDAMGVIASHGNSLHMLISALGSLDGVFIYGRLKELLNK